VIMGKCVDEVLYRAEQLEALLQTISENHERMEKSQLSMVVSASWDFAIEIKTWLHEETYKNDED
jgi:hypothetical protein